MLCAAGVSYKSLLVPLMVDGGIATSYADEYILDLVVDPWYDVCCSLNFYQIRYFKQSRLSPTSFQRCMFPCFLSCSVFKSVI